MKLSRIDRIQKVLTVADLFPQLDPATVTSVSVGLLPPLGRTNASPTAATAWTSYSVASGSATVMFVGPEADSTGAVAVPASADLWAKASGSFGEVEAVWVERITVTGSSATLPALPALYVSSVNGMTGAVTIAGGGGGGLSIVDNGDGTLSTTSSSVVDNGDGTLTAV